MAPSPRRLLSLVVVTIAAALPAAVVAENNSMPVADALVKLKKSFTNSSSLSSWLITDKDGDNHPCAPGSHEWHGVVCSGGGKVTGLRLNGLELGGTIDVDALASFPRLRSVSFAGNNFSGPLPAFHQLKALKSMYLSDNHFSGPLPDGFFANLSHLKKLGLDGNQLSGSIPASVAQATSLLELRLDRNDFTGELPPAPPPTPALAPAAGDGAPRSTCFWSASISCCSSRYLALMLSSSNLNSRCACSSHRVTISMAP